MSHQPMQVYHRPIVGVLILTLVPVSVGWAQEERVPGDTSEAWHEDAWTPIIEQDGLQISYIYYPEADTRHDGVVLRLVNENEVPVRYGFTIIFRAPAADTTAPVRGRVGPDATKTGDDAGLFWVPFRGKDRSLGEIGLRGLSVVPLQPDAFD
ncbi:hypothetical protein [Salinibacter grassmerensis]|uniref:hypothetical protein n=1 Tax=Salinibacter grassmerensis TaxID=3040353 RepID=UPI0021E884BB|nr:hypothetical protein [Salinibacter grassmerensis]